MKFRSIIWLYLGLLTLVAISHVSSQEPETWTLKSCIDHAKANNITVNKTRLNTMQNVALLEQAKASRLPDLSFNASNSFRHSRELNSSTGNYESQGTYSGSYSLNSGINLFSGFKTKYNIEQKQLDVEAGQFNVEESENNIEIAVAEAYLQVLYAQEKVKVLESVLESSSAQLEQSEILYKVGKYSESDRAIIKSQYAGDQYDLIAAQNDLNLQILALKQLLELGLGFDLELEYPVIEDSEVLAALPLLDQVYEKAQEIMPEVKAGDLDVRMAELDYKMAYANYFPSLSLSGSVGSGHSSSSDDMIVKQFENNLYQTVGLTLSIPIYSQKENKTNVELARIGIESAKLDLVQTKKTLLESVETVYQNAVSAQVQFGASLEQLESARLSYDLVNKQFSLGMKNSVELLTEKANYLTAQQNYLQTKYTAILNSKILEFYQGKSIEL